jgi:L-fuculose-phosphate aldolase
MTTDENVRADICEVGRRLYAQGYVASNDGNISVRLDEQRIMTTPTGVSKGFMTPDMMVIVDPTMRIRRPRPDSPSPASRSIAPCSPK